MEKERTAEISDPSSLEDGTFHLDKIETYRKIPIYHLEYGEPRILDREAHEKELNAIASLPIQRLALVISLQNLSLAAGYTPKDQADLFQSASMEKFREKMVAMVRYNSGSLASMIRTMTAHTYLRQALAAEFAPDREAAVRAARKGIDQFLDSRPALPG